LCVEFVLLNLSENPRHGFADNRSKNNIYTKHKPLGVPMLPKGKLQLLGFFHYNFWHKMSTLNEISSCIGTPRGLCLVYILFLDLLSAKPCLGFSDRFNRKCAMGTLQDWPWIINQQWFDQKDRISSQKLYILPENAHPVQ
jgi:hypothetical protein